MSAHGTAVTGERQPAPTGYVRAMENSLGQYCINVSDLDRSVRFWEEVVGIPVQSRTDIPTAKEVVLQAEVGGSRIQLAQQLGQDGPIDMGTAMWKLYVDTDDCQAVYDKAIAAGCESVSPPQQLDRWPVTVAFIKDPDGYLIEFVQNHEGKRPSLR
jgi:lactoylglutathione lyase